MAFFLRSIMQENAGNLKMIDDIINRLIEKNNHSRALKAVIGFDGAIDSIYNIVRSREGMGGFDCFKTISDFSVHIGKAAGKSCGLEAVKKKKKAGGNAPIMSNALSKLDVSTTCIAAIGKPEINDVFKSDMCNNKLTMISIGDPAITNSYEFDDGKIMIADISPLDDLDWKSIEDAVSIKELIRIYSEADLISLVNWSEVIRTNEIWKNLKSKVLCSLKKFPYIFIDISDPGKHTDKEIIEAVSHIESFRRCGRVILGLNENEAGILLDVILETHIETSDISEIAKVLFAEINVDKLVIHGNSSAVLISEKRKVITRGPFVETPSISTGGGDNFNAGLCYGHMNRFDDAQSLVFASVTSSFYVKNGYSPSTAELNDYLVLNKNRIEVHEIL